MLYSKHFCLKTNRVILFSLFCSQILNHNSSNRKRKISTGKEGSRQNSWFGAACCEVQKYKEYVYGRSVQAKNQDWGTCLLYKSKDTEISYLHSDWCIANLKTANQLFVENKNYWIFMLETCDTSKFLHSFYQ